MKIKEEKNGLSHHHHLHRKEKSYVMTGKRTEVEN